MPACDGRDAAAVRRRRIPRRNSMTIAGGGPICTAIARAAWRDSRRFSNLLDSLRVVRHDAPQGSVRIRIAHRRRMNLDEHPHRGIDREQEGPHSEEGAYGEPRESKHVQHSHLLRSAIALLYEPITNLAH